MHSWSGIHLGITERAMGCSWICVEKMLGISHQATMWTHFLQKAQKAFRESSHSGLTEKHAQSSIWHSIWGQGADQGGVFAAADHSRHCKPPILSSRQLTCSVAVPEGGKVPSSQQIFLYGELNDFRSRV